MKKLIAIVILFLAIAALGDHRLSAAEYRIEPGDVLMINVLGHNEILAAGGNQQGEELVVRPDGKISLPWMGDVQASGISVLALTSAIRQGLGEYIVNPVVSVNVVKFHTTRIYVLGEVTRPGMYELEKQHNLLDAIGIAGSYTKDAAKKHIFIIHKGHTDKPAEVNLLRLLEKGDMSQNIALSEGDVVYVTNNHRIDFARDILPWVTAAYQVHYIDNN
ncbi:polysaccharide export protein [Lucifera butyrica]|uniref:Polysaccharide export protein n=1 Tax=Lucifera butyrica TaxID=1351585 RepID=A0A498R9L9_9FIRM|nr:polysaccharide biosynthesis/export family protein [Lucifera butyrica]VBB09396.1 polysaccharide export protein [Lucifera butyrica]